jgi:hypothetical protein
MRAVIQGVDDAWEVCLLKFTVEMIAKSRGINEFDFKRLIGNRFKIVECFGQNPVHPIISKSSRMIAKILGTRIAVKFNQGLKCRWFLFDAMKLHEVQKSSRIMEYFVWVMQK